MWDNRLILALAAKVARAAFCKAFMIASFSGEAQDWHSSCHSSVCDGASNAMLRRDGLSEHWLNSRSRYVGSRDQVGRERLRLFPRLKTFAVAIRFIVVISFFVAVGL
ncbi:hypothetical protein AD939_07965 [Gluconobacter oxydans]|nr:hypothetical protein AD939_07965 [Gluconobacter oxydans]